VTLLDRAAEAWPVIAVGLVVVALFVLATGRGYVRRIRTGLWAYGIRRGRLRLRAGTAPTQAEAIAQVDQIVHPDQETP
jgi:hypothetical protein